LVFFFWEKEKAQKVAKTKKRNPNLLLFEAPKRKVCPKEKGGQCQQLTVYFNYFENMIKIIKNY